MTYATSLLQVQITLQPNTEALWTDLAREKRSYQGWSKRGNQAVTAVSAVVIKWTRMLQSRANLDMAQRQSSSTRCCLVQGRYDARVQV